MFSTHRMSALSTDQQYQSVEENEASSWNKHRKMSRPKVIILTINPSGKNITVGQTGTPNMCQEHTKYTFLYNSGGFSENGLDDRRPPSGHLPGPNRLIIKKQNCSTFWGLRLKPQFSGRKTPTPTTCSVPGLGLGWSTSLEIGTKPSEKLGPEPKPQKLRSLKIYFFNPGGLTSEPLISPSLFTIPFPPLLYSVLAVDSQLF